MASGDTTMAVALSTSHIASRLPSEPVLIYRHHAKLSGSFLKLPVCNFWPACIRQLCHIKTCDDQCDLLWWACTHVQLCCFSA